ncbi:MAG TPA: hypothetical protein V6D05_10980 [Stenomitos sp.]
MRERRLYSALLFAMTAATVGCSQQLPTTTPLQTADADQPAQATEPQQQAQATDTQATVDDRQVMQRTRRRSGRRSYSDRRYYDYPSYYPYYSPYYYPTYYPRYTDRRVYTDRRTGYRRSGRR